jgi:hypothetical protein
MLKIHANAAQTEAIKSAALFLVVVRRDTGYGVSPADLKVVPATKVDTLRTISTGRRWNSRESVVAPNAKKFCKDLAKLGVNGNATFIGDNSRYGGGYLNAPAIKIHPVAKDGSVGEGITLVRIGGDFYAPVYANRWVKDYAIAHGGNIHKVW